MSRIRGARVSEKKSDANVLPPGWIELARRRRRIRKKDSYYIDPESGYALRSLKDVFRYIETKDLSSCSRPFKWHGAVAASAGELAREGDVGFGEPMSKRVPRLARTPKIVSKTELLEEETSLNWRSARPPPPPGKGKLSISMREETDGKRRPESGEDRKEHSITSVEATNDATPPLRKSPRLAVMRAANSLGQQRSSTSDVTKRWMTDAATQTDPVASPEQPAVSGKLDLSSQFGNSWLDPCIEFAYKTLASNVTPSDCFNLPPFTSATFRPNYPANISRREKQTVARSFSK